MTFLLTMNLITFVPHDVLACYPHHIIPMNNENEDEHELAYQKGTNDKILMAVKGIVLFNG